MQTGRRTFLFFLFVLLTGTTCLFTGAGASAAIPDEPFSKDPRLQRLVTLHAIGVSLEDLLAQVSKSGPGLTCYRTLGSQKLQVHLQQRPVHMLMSALASLLEGKWKAREDKQGYILEPSETMARDRDRWWQAFLDERKAALAAQSAFMRSKMRKTPQERPVDVGNAAPGSITPDTARSLFNSLPDDQLSRIAGNIDDSPFFTVDNPYMAGDNEGSTMIAFNQLPDATRQMLTQQTPSLTNASSSTWMQIINIGSLVSAQVMNQDGTSLSGSYVLNISDSPVLDLLKLEQNQLPEKVRKMNGEASANLKLLVSYQEKTVWKNDPANREPAHQFPPPRRAEVLQWLAEKANIEFVADYYSKPGVPLFPPQWAQTPQQPLQEELNIRAVEQDMSWKAQDGLYLFRNNRWYRDDLLEVPPFLAKRWITRRVRASEKPGDTAVNVVRNTVKGQLDADTEFATNLSRWQMANGLKWLALEDALEKPDSNRQPSGSPFRIFPFYGDAQHIMQEYNIARFYGSLPPDAQDALLEKRLPFSELTPAQREQVIHLNPILQSFAGPPLKDVKLGLAPVGLFQQKIGLVFSTC